MRKVLFLVLVLLFSMSVVVMAKCKKYDNSPTNVLVIEDEAGKVIGKWYIKEERLVPKNRYNKAIKAILTRASRDIFIEKQKLLQLKAIIEQMTAEQKEVK